MAKRNTSRLQKVGCRINRQALHTTPVIRYVTGFWCSR